MLKPHEHRVLDEHTELTDKLSRLDSFIASEKVNSITVGELALLRKQRCAMRDYRKILAHRISLFAGGNQSNGAARPES